MRLEGGRSETHAILFLAEEQRNAAQAGPRHIFVGRLSLSFRGVGEVTQAEAGRQAVQSESNLKAGPGKRGGLSVRRRGWECRKDDGTANGRRVEGCVKMGWEGWMDG